MNTQASTVQEELSDEIIPAVPGEFYSYSAEFTTERPAYFLMKCKANKARSVNEAEEHQKEISLFFIFEDHKKQVCDIQTACRFRYLGSRTEITEFDDAWISSAKITSEEFDQIRATNDVDGLITATELVVAESMTAYELEVGMIFAVVTIRDKYCLFRVTELTPTSIKIDACHILL